MSKKLYVGNLPYSIGNEDLEQLFNQVGTVESARIVTDRDSGRSKGFGFVEMAEAGDADKAITELNGKEVDGRSIRVDVATEKPRGGGGGGGGGGRGGFRGGGRR